MHQSDHYFPYPDFCLYFQSLFPISSQWFRTSDRSFFPFDHWLFPFLNCNCFHITDLCSNANECLALLVTIVYGNFDHYVQLPVNISLSHHYNYHYQDTILHYRKLSFISDIYRSRIPDHNLTLPFTINHCRSLISTTCSADLANAPVHNRPIMDIITSIITVSPLTLNTVS